MCYNVSAVLRGQYASLHIICQINSHHTVQTDYIDNNIPVHIHCGQGSQQKSVTSMGVDGVQLLCICFTWTLQNFWLLQCRLDVCAVVTQVTDVQVT